MSITSALFTGVSGLLNNAEGMNVIGNNISNVNTIGFKGARTLFADMLSTPTTNRSQMGHGTTIQKIDNLFTQSSFESTNVVTDLAIQGDSFFALAGPSDPKGTALTGEKAYYTRAGAFRLTPDTTVAPPVDLYLSNADGYRVLDTEGYPITIPVAAAPPAATDIIKITAIDSDGKISMLRGDGTVAYYSAAAGVPVAGGDTNAGNATRIGTLRVPYPGELEKFGGTLFKASNPATGVDSSTVLYSATWNSTTSLPTQEKLFSNNLEQSNVDMATEFVKMILTQRAYSANSKTITTADEMTQEVLNLKR
ncbi:MAG: flagellar hook basal-body protein [Geobacteraceae bacterium]|nr:flagellar hook basal-body protein [Geobacteraceae bacterium]